MPVQPNQNPMAAALLGPDLLQRQYQIEQNRKYADILLNQSMQTPQGQMVSGHYVPASFTQHLANALSGYVSGKINSDLPRQQAELATAQSDQIGRGFGLGPSAQGPGSTPATAGPSMTSPSGDSADMGAQGAGQGYPGGNSASGSGAPIGGQPTMPIPPGMSPQQAAMLYQTNPNEYARALVQYGAPNDSQKTLLSMGIRPGTPQWNQAMAQIARKDGYIAPVNAAPGSTIIDPITGQPTFYAPKDGIGINYGPNGPVATPVPNWREANAANAGAEASAVSGAQAMNKPIVVNRPGGPVMTTEGQVAGQVNGTVPGAGGAQLSPVATPASPGGIPLESDTAKKFGEAIGEKSASSLLDGRDKAKTAADSLLGIEQARQAMDKGAFQSTGADWKLGAIKFINANIPGLTVDSTKAGNTDYLKSILGEGLLQQAKTLGSNPSNADAQRINDIVGSIDKDPQAMRKILDWRQEMATRSIQTHNSTVDDAEKRGLSSPYDLRVRAPEVQKKDTASTSPVPRDNGGMYAPRTKAERDAIPSGSLYRDPSGTIRSKP